MITHISKSTLHMRTPPVIGVDPGERWTGICVRVGNTALWAATIGHIGPAPTSIDDDWAEWTAYWGQVCDWTVHAWRATFPDERVDVVAETPIEEPWRNLKGTKRYVAQRRYMACVGLVGALQGRWPGLITIKPQGFSGAHQKSNRGTGDPDDYYDRPLIGRRGAPRPEHFGPNQHPKNVMIHEQCAYAIAAAGVEGRCEYVIPERWKVAA